MSENKIIYSVIIIFREIKKSSMYKGDSMKMEDLKFLLLCFTINIISVVTYATII